MLNRLQTRLLLAFTLVLVIALCIIATILTLFLRSRPVPTDNIINDLAATSLDTDFRTLVEALRQNATRNPPQRDIEILQAFLDENAASTDFRILVTNTQQRVLYDSAGIYGIDTRVNILEQQPMRPDGVTGPAGFSNGRFRDPNGKVWLFVARMVLRQNDTPVGSNGNRDTLPTFVVDYWVATPEPQQNWRRVADSFSENFLVPLCLAGGVSMTIALGLSFWLSRSVARPLWAISDAAGYVANGHYEQRVPITGPTEARIVAAAFNDMTEQVKLTQQAQQDFIANVTHDLRTPLTSIQGFSQAIMDGVASEPAAAQHAARVINDEASRLNRLVTDLLDIAKIRAGRLQMLRQAVELDRVLQTVGDSMKIKAGQKNVTLHVNIPQLTRIAGDGDRLAQVFTNLVDNAIKHTDAGGSVWLMSKLEGHGILVQVQDTGEGIPEDDLSRIFERFYQVDKSRNRDAQRGGAGLGLAITYEIIVAHGGRIWVESQVGVGTRFSVWLPMLTGDRSTVIQLKP